MSMAGAGSASPQQGAQWGLWKRQVAGLLRMEVGKYLFSKRAFVLYFLAFLPIFLFVLWALQPLFQNEMPGIGEGGRFYAGMYQTLMLRLVIFFGCIITFTNLFRGELLDHTLHYYFLCPIRREVLVAGKFIAGQIACWIVFSASVAISFFLAYFPYGQQGIEFFTQGPGLGHLLAYIGVIILACAGYGAVFLLVGLLGRNPILPAAAVFLWETINPFLPALLQKISVIHYLDSLCPVRLTGGNFRIVTDPAPAWLSVPGLIVMMLIVLGLAALKLRRTEISYGGD